MGWNRRSSAASFSMCFLYSFERGGADALQLSARQGRFQHVGGVDGALRAAGADDRVQLVDEQHHVAGREDLLHDPLQPLLELAAVLRPGDEGGEVERQHPLSDEHLGHRPVDDLLRQAFDDCRLADARASPMTRDCSSCRARGSG